GGSIRRLAAPAPADRRRHGMVDIVDFLAPRGVVAQLRVSNKKQALLEIARRAAAVTRVAERTICEGRAEGERPGSPGIGKGVAIPHGKLAGLSRIYAFFARLERPIPFEAIDNQPIDLMFVLLAPPDAGAEHLRALAAASRLLRDNAICQKLRGTDSADALLALLSDGSESSAA